MHFKDNNAIVIGASKGIGLAISKFSIKVTCLSPGSVNTRFSNARGQGQGPNKKNSIS